MVGSFKRYDWAVQDACMGRIMDEAGRLGIWVVVGTAHRLSGKHKPHNSVYLVNDQGKLVNRYDKRILVGAPGKEEHAHFTPGSEPITFSLNGVTCGLLICHEWRYPEIYRQYLRMGVRVIFQSWYDSNLSKGRYRRAGALLGEVMVSSIRDRAANNNFWISVSNTCEPESCFASYVVRPDGKIAGRLARHRSGVLLSTIHPEREYVDLSKHWRDKVMRGILHSDHPVNDPRSRRRTSL
jgi:predicted amidohydrolase